jgi:DNA repair protein RecN (Recombination protein N)
MLLELIIENFAIIDRLVVSFAPGLNIITGETGTGKSILVGALDFLLGGKVFKDMIRSGEEKATVEASFNTDHMRETLLVKRELFRSGKTKASINNKNSTLQQLKETGKLLVDIMGQHDHQSLLDPANHLAYLDKLADLTVTVQKFSQKHHLREEKIKRMKQLRTEQEIKDERKRLLEFQIEEIDKANLKIGEEQDLIRESKTLAHAEKILQTCRVIKHQLQEADNSLLGALSGFSKDIQEPALLDKRLKPIAEGVDSARIQLEEVAYNTERYLHDADFNPDRQAIVEERLDELYRLKKKYSRSLEELVIYRQEMEQEFQDMQHSQDEERELAEKAEKLSDELCREAHRISRKRKNAAEDLQHKIVAELALLGIPQCRFPVQFLNTPTTGDELGVDGAKIEDTGLDKVNFLFSANPGEKPKNLSNIVSGGELSRIMLGLKNLLGEKDAINILVFDEVDVGIGGKTAIKVGEKLKSISSSHQIICITHLPQIARFADRHLVVDKIRQANRTVSRVRVLAETEQNEELARMMGPAT